MPPEELLCTRRAHHTKTCSQRSEIYTTPGDVHRIREFTGQAEFTEYRQPENDEYGDHDDDPVWRDQVFRDDLAKRCPLELLRPRQNLIEAVEIMIGDARRWHQQLYQEIQSEVHN